MSSLTLSSLPAELWLDILLRACVADGGRTGCALSASSTTLRTLVAPFRYDTVALEGLPAINAFAELMADNTRAGVPPPAVTRLYISERAPPAALADDPFEQSYRAATLSAPAESAKSSAAASAAAASATIAPSWDALEAMDADIGTILSALAPTLTQLGVLGLTFPSIDAFVPGEATLPCLEELTIVGVPMCAAGQQAPSARLPALRRLHVLADEAGWRALRVPAGVTHARMSNSSRADADALAPHPYEDAAAADQDADASAPAPTQVVLHPRPTPAVDSELALRAGWEARLAVGARAAVVLNGNATYTLRQARADWFARAQGGDGCWALAGAVVRAAVVDA
jgi:hypothetical protein